MTIAAKSAVENSQAAACIHQDNSEPPKTAFVRRGN